MRTLAFLFALVLVASFASAQDPAANPPAKPEIQKAPGATKEFTGQVVSTDLMGKTITVKRSDLGTGAKQETTLPVEGSAVDALKTVNPGESVKLLCRTDSMGKETAVTSIQKDTKAKP